jgi:hypothetical protein
MVRDFTRLTHRVPIGRERSYPKPNARKSYRYSRGERVSPCRKDENLHLSHACASIHFSLE